MDSSASTTSGGTSITRINIINVIAYIVNVAVTYGIGVGGVFGLPTNSELSAKYQTLVTPVGWAFSIWAIIFLLQLVWVVAQLIGKFRQSEFVTKVGYGYVRVVAAQVGWTFAFSGEVIWLSLAFMVAIWIALLWIVVPLSKVEGTVGEYFLWKCPFTLHCGWISAATVVNINVLLVDFGLSASMQFYAALASIAALLVFGLGVICARVDLVIPVVLAWALVGVYVELLEAPESISAAFSNSEIKQVRYLGAGIALSLLVSVILQVIQAGIAARREGSTGSAEESRYLRQEDA